MLLYSHVLYHAFISLSISVCMCVCTELEFCVFVMDLLFSGFELVFIIIAFTVMCLFGLAAVYTHNTDHQGKYTFYPPTQTLIELMTKTKCNLYVCVSHR